MRTDRLHSDDALLRKALGANAAFSGLSALILLIAAQPIGRILGSVPTLWLYAIGGMLALFSLHLWLQVRAEEIDPGQALGVSVADLAWVVGSAALLIVQPEALSGEGLLLVALVAVIVLGMAVSQLAGLRRLGASRAG